MSKELSLWHQLNEIIERSRRIVFFGGAGVSTASGIPDFRSADGLFSGSAGLASADRQQEGSSSMISAEGLFSGSAGVSAEGLFSGSEFVSAEGLFSESTGVSPEDILSATYFALHTKEFFDFYRRYMVYPDAKPNAAHRYLYYLEKRDKLRAVVTQNIDGLHKKAGNKRVYELHGSIYENYCIDCETFYPLEKIMQSSGVPRCEKCGGIIKPWVVLYGEIPDKYTGIGACREISGADTMIVAGTSLAVEPAASYIEYFTGRNLVIINKSPTPADSRATLLIREDIEKVFAELAALTELTELSD